MLFAGKQSQKSQKTQTFSWFRSDRLHVSVTGLLHDCFFSSWIASRSCKNYGKRLHLDVTGRSPTLKNSRFFFRFRRPLACEYTHRHNSKQISLKNVWWRRPVTLRCNRSPETAKSQKTQAFSRFGSDRLHLNVTGLLHD